MISTTKKKAVTHSGSFHADDVFAAVVLQKIFPKIIIKRTRDAGEIEKADIIFDIGGIYDPKSLKFDHHQNDAPVRKNGIPYSSFGMIWKEYGEQYCGGAAVADRIEQRFVQLVDAGDNGVSLTQNLIDGVSPMTIEDMIATFAPNLLGKPESAGRQFVMATDWARTFLDRLVAKEIDIARRIEYISEKITASPDERYVVLDKPVLYERIAVNHPKLLFVVLPNESNGTWGVRTVRKNPDGFEPRKPLPAEWAGHIDEDLAEITGVSDAIFAHKMRFLAVANSREGALKLLELAL